MSITAENELPVGAASLIAVARIAHSEGNRALERSAANKLAKDYGIEVHFTCTESVNRELQRGAKR